MIPAAALSQHIVVLGKTGAGKSSALRYVVEGLLNKGKRVCIVDPKGDWWGLKVAADGKSPGMPVVLLGDFKNQGAQDVPINERSGKHIAELVSDGNRPCVIGLRGWTQGGMTKFWIDFASTLFARNSGELFLVGDEFHNFAPKQWRGMADKQTPVGVGLHWANRLLSEGRGLGLVCLIASQRPQKVHNDTLTSCETLVAMRVTHGADRDAVETWIEGCGDKEVGQKVVKSLAAMPRGQAWVWSPEIGFGPTQVTFPMFSTFDSFAPPQVQKRVSEKGWAEVDLSEVKNKLAEAVKEAEANDPKLLRARIAELERQAKAKPAPAVDQAALDRAHAAGAADKDRELRPLLEQAERANALLAGRMGAAKSKVGELAELLVVNGEVIDREKPCAIIPNSRISPAKVAGTANMGKSHIKAASPLPAITSAVGTDAGRGDLPKGAVRRILTALAQHPEGLSYRKIGVFADVSTRGGSFTTYLSRCRTAGWIEGNDSQGVMITGAGLEALGEFSPLPTGPDLADYWLREIGADNACGKILRVLIESYPNPMTYDEIGEAAEVSTKGGSFTTYLSRLRSRDLITGTNKGVLASEELF